MGKRTEAKGYPMNRRKFFGLLAGAGAATATSYFLPPIGGWKSDGRTPVWIWEHTANLGGPLEHEYHLIDLNENTDRLISSREYHTQCARIYQNPDHQDMIRSAYRRALDNQRELVAARRFL